jgi:hypothetical protein
MSFVGRPSAEDDLGSKTPRSHVLSSVLTHEPKEMSSPSRYETKLEDDVRPDQVGEKNPPHADLNTHQR